MKLAFCLFRYYPFGGLERDFIRIMRECCKRGYAADVYTMRWEGEKPAGINIILVPYKGFTNHGRCRSFIKNLQSKLADKRYDLVVGFNRMPGLDFYYAADVCYQQSVREKHSLYYRWLSRYRTYAGFEKAVFNAASHTQILLLVERERNYYRHYYQTAIDRFHLMPPGIDPKRIAFDHKAEIKQKIRDNLNITHEHKMALMVGSDFKRKGVDRVLHAVAVLPKSLLEKFQLVIAGAGDIATLQHLAQQLKILDRVNFIGATENVGEYMLAADFLLHPARQETAGMVLLEALVAGLPVLVTENCGYAFHIQRANAGLIVPGPYDQKKFNIYLQTMLTSLEWSQWQLNARLYAEREDLYRLPECAADLFEKFITTSR